MKRSLLLVIPLALILLCLCACGAETPAPTAAPTPTPAPAAPSLQSVLPGSDLTPAATPEPVVETVVESNPLVDAAMACIGEDVSVLYKAIGEPSDSSYAPSCLGIGTGGEDGELYYDGFYVATYREGTRETVRDVIVDVG